jgi:hypothetical protein
MGEGRVRGKNKKGNSYTINLIVRRFSQITTDDDTVKNQKCPLSLEGRGLALWSKFQYSTG